MAKIIFLKKFSKFNYVDLNIFYLISFFLILSKVIGVIITERFNYLIKKYYFLSLNYYKILKQKSIINTLFII